jgi:uncharacterized protein YeaC (DUF1315 family)
MEYNQLIAQLTPEVYLRLKAAIEIGKCRPKASCLEAILRYQSMKLDPQQHSGYMPDQCASSSSSAPKKTDEQVIKIH